MKALWKVEAIGSAARITSPRRTPPPLPWLAELTGLSARFGLRREFMPGQLDYLHSKFSGGRGARSTRGVFMHWVLEPDRRYEASWSPTWSRRERAFLRVVDGRVERVDREEVEAWLRRRLNVARISEGSVSTS